MWYYWVTLAGVLTLCLWLLSGKQTLARGQGTGGQFNPNGLLAGMRLFLDYDTLPLKLAPGVPDPVYGVFDASSESIGMPTAQLLLLQHFIVLQYAGVYTLLPTTDGALQVLKIQDALIDPGGNIEFVNNTLPYKSATKEGWVDTLRGKGVASLLSKQFGLNDGQISALIEPCLDVGRGRVRVVEMQVLLDDLKDLDDLNRGVDPVKLHDRLKQSYATNPGNPILTFQDKSIDAASRYESLSERLMDSSFKHTF